MKAVQILTTLQFDDDADPELNFDFNSLGHAIGEAIMGEDIGGLEASTTDQLADKVFVIMGNDFPAYVFTDEAEANAYVARLNKENAELCRKHVGATPIQWRVSPQPLNPSV